MKLTEIIEAARASLADGDPSLISGVPVLIISLDSPRFLKVVPASHMVALRAASIATPLTTKPLRVQSVDIQAGPLEDGTTPNTSPIYIGGPNVAVGNGRELVAGSSVSIGAVDLSQIYVVGITATDVIRLFYLVE